MELGNNQKERSAVLMIVAIYALVGGLWIYLSDSMLARLIQDPHLMAQAGVFKGLIFILLTSVLLYNLIANYVERLITSKRMALESEERFKTIYDYANDAVFIHHAGTGEVLDVNQTMCAMYGYSREEALRLKVSDISLGTPPFSQAEALEWLDRAAMGTPQVFEWLCKRKDGSLFWTEVSMRQAVIGGEERIIVLVRDITERKKTLEEKVAMLQEIHHRTKNNLQIIGSLLSLQSQSIDDASCRNIIIESQNRINALGLIHDKLYETNSLADIDLGNHLKKICCDLSVTYTACTQSTVFRFNVDPVHVDIETAVPCGLIINELVSNSLKHAFADAPVGENVVEIGLTRSDADMITLTVKDNGRGLPKELDFFRSKTLGLRLVKILVDQLEGTIDLDTGSGTTYSIAFRYPLRSRQAEGAPARARVLL